MSTSLSWTELPEWLLEPLMFEVIKLHEAVQIWDCVLMEPGETASLPPHLWPAAARLHLWEMDVPQTVH